MPVSALITSFSDWKCLQTLPTSPWGQNSLHWESVDYVIIACSLDHSLSSSTPHVKSTTTVSAPCSQENQITGAVMERCVCAQGQLRSQLRLISIRSISESAHQLPGYPQLPSDLCIWGPKKLWNRDKPFLLCPVEINPWLTESVSSDNYLGWLILEEVISKL